MAETASAARLRRRRARRRRLIAASAGVVVAGVGSAVAVAETTGSDPGLRLATVGRASITAVVEASGTVVSSDKVAASFPVSGTVQSVDVAVDESVRKGQLLARLDTTELRTQLDEAAAALAQARQRLEADKSGQTSGASSGSASSGASTNAATYTRLGSPAGTSGAGSTGGDASALVRRIESAQQAVIAAQRALDTGQAAVDAAQRTLDADVTQNTALRDAEQRACATGADASIGPDTPACASAQADYEHFADTLGADSAALTAAVRAQDGAVTKLDASVAALDQLLRALPNAVSSQTGGSGGGGSRRGGTGSSGSSDAGSSSSGPSNTGPSNTGPSKIGSSNTGSSGTGGSSTPASASQLAADQAQIDSASAQVHEAQQNLAAAALRSPIDGRVAAIGLTAGQSSSGGSVTVVGTGVQKVTVEVPLAQIGLVKVGQPVAVAADGTSTTLRGTIAAIGILSTTSGSTTTFPVTVQLAADSPRLYDGSGADVRITTGTARDVVAVPNSAIHTLLGGRHTVTVVHGSSTSTVPVTLGVSGTDVTEVKSGLKPGDEVELADLGRAVPASTTNASNDRFARLLAGGGFAGGGGGFVGPGR